ncbi:MAG: hypothetical protein HYV45_02600 [Candidatus Moranbacteria bacterium]|nr:hypothetical protein [Candidatus Moranbacteria bacterium]
MVLPVIAQAARGAVSAIRGATSAAGRSATTKSTSSLRPLDRAREAKRVYNDVYRRAVTDRQGKNASSAQFTGKKPSIVLYTGVGCIALLKDLLDLVGIGSFPGIGTVVTLCFTFLIWMLLTLFDSSSKQTRSNMQLMRGLVVIGFGLIEAIGFGLNFMPIETAMVVLLYHLARKAWREAQQAVPAETT